MSKRYHQRIERLNTSTSCPFFRITQVSTAVPVRNVRFVVRIDGYGRKFTTRVVDGCLRPRGGGRSLVSVLECVSAVVLIGDVQTVVSIDCEIAVFSNVLARFDDGGLPISRFVGGIHQIGIVVTIEDDVHLIVAIDDDAVVIS